MNNIKIEHLQDLPKAASSLSLMQKETTTTLTLPSLSTFPNLMPA